jgi:hypothetical protein
LIKRTAVEAVESDKPTAVMFGTVTAVSPLVVEVEQKLSLGGEALVCLKNVTVDVGESVLLLREQGGQRFFVLGVI